ncbi:MAG: hypothetical protein CL912_27750 [Deltaproteobacteria bacterium]|nr:hypothetical protein [Deltaproteobacteria bacterium]
MTENTPVNALFNATALADSLDSTIYDSMPRLCTKTKIFHLNHWPPPEPDSRDKFARTESDQQEGQGHRQQEVRVVKAVVTNATLCLYRA